MQKKLEQLMTEFKVELSYLNNKNLVIGGSNILKYHGLELGWEPQDLDVIIFIGWELTKDVYNKQTNFVREKMESCSEYEIDEASANKAGKEIFKIERNGLSMNIILYYFDTPVDLLYTIFENQLYKVNSISNIIEAKLSYVDGQTKELREKDKNQISLLKANNFNIRESKL